MTANTTPEIDRKPITIEAKDVERGDSWAGRLEVASAKAKEKFTYIEFIDGSKKRILNTEAVHVWRETEESANARYEARRRDRINDVITDWLDRYEERRHTKAAHAKINAILAHDNALVDDLAMRQFIEAQGTDKVAAQVHYNLDRYRKGETGYSLADAPDLYAAAEIIAGDFRDRAFTVSPLSRSTSVIGNVMEDVERAAAADFAKRWNSGWFR